MCVCVCLVCTVHTAHSLFARFVWMFACANVNFSLSTCSTNRVKCMQRIFAVAVAVAAVAAAVATFVL